MGFEEAVVAATSQASTLEEAIDAALMEGLQKLQLEPEPEQPAGRRTTGSRGTASAHLGPLVVSVTLNMNGPQAQQSGQVPPSAADADAELDWNGYLVVRAPVASRKLRGLYLGPRCGASFSLMEVRLGFEPGGLRGRLSKHGYFLQYVTDENIARRLWRETHCAWPPPRFHLR